MSVTGHQPEDASEEGRRLWAAALALNRDDRGVSLRPLPPLLFFTDRKRTPNPWLTAQRLPPGAGVVYRHFGRDDAQETALRLRRATADRGVRLMIGLDAPLAEAVGADGLHLPERALHLAPRHRRAFPDWLITGAFHGGPVPAREVLAALDAVVISPIFATASLSPPRPPLGGNGVRQLAEALARPIYALGGVDAENAPELRGSGVCGIAGVEAIARAFGG